MILLSIVTLSYYEVYWLVTQKPYLVKKTGAKLPSSWWLIGSAIATIPFYVFFAFLLFTSLLNLTATIIGIVVLLLLSLSPFPLFESGG